MADVGRRAAVVVVGLMGVAACSGPSSGVDVVRAEPTASTLPPVGTGLPHGSLPSEPPQGETLHAVSLLGAPLGEVAVSALLAVPHRRQDTEMAVHALTDTPDGWLAVGSTTESGKAGRPTVWYVTDDGSFGPGTALPPVDAVEGVARSAIADATTTTVVGNRGSGRDSAPMAWQLDGVGDWYATQLPLDQPAVHGAIADQVLRLADGTVVVVGRGMGPFYSELLFWWTTDGGITWDWSDGSLATFLEPLVATDGERIAIFARAHTISGGLAGHAAAVYTIEDGALNVGDAVDADLTPGRRFWPRSLTWDGSAFVLGLGLDISPAIASSPDGLTYTTMELHPEGLDPSVPSNVVHLAMVGGALLAAIEQGGELHLYRRDGEAFTLLDVPYQPSGNLRYVEARRLAASDGLRYAYIAADWDGLTMLTGAADSWRSTRVRDMPSFRNAERLEVTAIASAGDSDLAVLNQSSTEAPGRFSTVPIGVLWRPPGADRWQIHQIAAENVIGPTAVTAWGDDFLVATYDSVENRSAIYRLISDDGTSVPLTSVDGYVRSFVANRSDLYAHIFDVPGGASSNSALQHSFDGANWSDVELRFPPRLLCSDGDGSAVVMWMSSNGGNSTMGAARLDGPDPVPVLDGFEFEQNRVLPEQGQTMRCGVSQTDLVTSLNGPDAVIAAPTPQVKLTRLTPSPRSSDLVLQVARDGAWKSEIRSVLWDGHQWVAVGSGGDVEEAWDALLWTSEDGLVWDPAITIAGGPGNQIANTIVIRNGEMLIGGVDGQNAVVWTVAA